MGRLVRKPVVPDLDLQIAGLEGVLQSDIAGMQMAAAVPGDNYLERMVKYIPGEMIGFSMLINAILDQAMKAGGPSAAMAGLPITAIATGALLDRLHPDAAVLLVCARGRRRLDRQCRRSRRSPSRSGPI